MFIQQVAAERGTALSTLINFSGITDAFSILITVGLFVGVVGASAVVSGITDRTAVRGVNGDITLVGQAGPVTVETVAGNVEAQAVSGDLRVNTVSGDLIPPQQTQPAPQQTAQAAAPQPAQGYQPAPGPQAAQDSQDPVAEQQRHENPAL